MKTICTIVFFLLLIQYSNAQQPAYWNDIQNFKKQDSAKKPAPGQVLFVGSSSFTMWRDVQEYFPSVQIINRGFGGSSLPDLWRYKEDVITPYQPKQIVMYCGENDFAASDTVTVATVVGRFKQLYTWIRSKYGNIPFVYVSMKPSPSRRNLMPKYEAANKEIAKYLKKYKNTKFVDVYHSMLKPDGEPMTDIFIGDNLHMNAKGYAIWKKLLEPHLLK